MHHAACMRAFTRKSKSHISKYSDTCTRIHQFSCRRPYLALVRSTMVCVYTSGRGPFREYELVLECVCVHTTVCTHGVYIHTGCVHTLCVHTVCTHTHWYCTLPVPVIPRYLQVVLNLVPYRYLYWYSSNSRCTGTPAFSCGRFKGISKSGRNSCRIGKLVIFVVSGYQQFDDVSTYLFMFSIS